MSPKWDANAVEAAATEVAEAVFAGEDRPFLQWTKDRSKVRLKTGEIVPDGAAQTVAGRARRLGAALRPKLEGWVEGESGWWQRTSTN